MGDDADREDCLDVEVDPSLRTTVVVVITSCDPSAWQTVWEDDDIDKMSSSGIPSEGVFSAVAFGAFTGVVGIFGIFVGESGFFFFFVLGDSGEARGVRGDWHIVAPGWTLSKSFPKTSLKMSSGSRDLTFEGS